MIFWNSKVNMFVITQSGLLKWHIQLMGHIRPAVMRWVVQVGCVLSLDIPLALGPSPQALTLFGRVGFIAWCLGECWRGQRHFWECWVRVGSGPAPVPTSKKALRHTCLVGRTEDKYHLKKIFFPFKLILHVHIFRYQIDQIVEMMWYKASLFVFLIINKL